MATIVMRVAFDKVVGISVDTHVHRIANQACDYHVTMHTHMRPPVHALCTRHAHAMHTPCTRHAHAMHTPCTRAMHAPARCGAARVGSEQGGGDEDTGEDSGRARGTQSQCRVSAESV